jgi:hypothetical protein
MFLLAYGRSTCPELASRVDTKVSHDDTVSWEEGRWAVWPEPAVTAVVLFVHSGSLSVFFAAALTHTDDRDWRAGRALDDGDDPTAGAALLRPLDPHEPQGSGESSVPTLEASSRQVERP